ncbi:hypothetical protein CMV_003074 [Castanea mollissima]|uniref:Disease resistance RPP13-like protein 4 n=1 Tax=Castanea mollissima TaxID=60419 RepID=A0A8J4VWI0_9ROSI|nr:hypothetical protein CMV_003074 [Castanea mollissima]
MSSSVDFSTQNDEILTFENIIATLSTLLTRLSQFKDSVPRSSSSNHTTDNNSGSNDLNNDNTIITATTTDNGHSLNEECLVTHRQFDKLQRDLNQIKEAFRKLKNFEHDAGEPIKNLECCLDDISNIVSEASNDAFPNKEVQAKLSAIKKDALKLKLNFPPLRPKMSTKDSVHRRSRPTNGSNSVVNELPSLPMNRKFVCSSVFTEFKEVFENLDMRLKLCLLSFAVLPEDVVVKRRLLINWWVGEGLVDPPSTGEKRAEDVADEILKELELKGFIEHVKGRHKPVANRNSFKMQPLVHCVVFMLAQEAGFFDCQFNGIPTVNSSRCNRAYLVKDEDGVLEKVLKSSPDLDQEKLQTIFNVNESFPDLRFESFAKIKKVSIVEWFSRMKNVQVLYLGRWKSSDQQNIEEQSSDQGVIVWEGSLENHIEVESTDFLEGLKNMKRLRLLSLQGISRINELPDSIGKLTNLRILDLKACHNLEALPEGLALLKKLSHLDISECYLLDGMPKGIAFLTELQVLKGFVVGNLESNINNNQQGLPRQFLGGMCFPQKRDSCTLKDLIKLKLRKLRINTSIKAFPREEELEVLEKLKELRKLAIAWSVNSNQQENGVPSSADTINSDSRRQDSGAAKSTSTPIRLNSQ